MDSNLQEQSDLTLFIFKETLRFLMSRVTATVGDVTKLCRAARNLQPFKCCQCEQGCCAIAHSGLF